MNTSAHPYKGGHPEPFCGDCGRGPEHAIHKLPEASPNDTVVLTVAVGTNASGEVVSVSGLPGAGQACALCGEVQGDEVKPQAEWGMMDHWMQFGENVAVLREYNSAQDPGFANVLGDQVRSRARKAILAALDEFMAELQGGQSPSDAMTVMQKRVKDLY